MRRPAWRRTALAGTAVLVLLLVPLPLPKDSRMGHAAAGAVHVLLFAGLARAAGSVWPERISRGFLWLGLALLAAVVETIQPLVGRSAGWADWLYGAGGAACLCGGWPLRPGTRRRWVALGALALFPPVWEAAMWHQEIRAFPVLAQSGAWWARRSWTLNGVDLSVDSHRRFKVAGRAAPDDGAPSPYPGVFRRGVHRDWRGVESLRTAVFWPKTEPAVFAVRVDDRPGNPPYAERFQKELLITQGWNVVEIPAAEFGRSAGGRPLNLENVCQWGVFLVSNVPLDYFLLEPVHLVPARNAP